MFFSISFGNGPSSDLNFARRIAHGANESGRPRFNAVIISMTADSTLHYYLFYFSCKQMVVDLTSRTGQIEKLLGRTNI